MKSLADGLPAEVAAQVSEVWRANETAYWVARDDLLVTLAGQWVAFADGKVVASGRSRVEVFHAAHQAGGHPYFARAGHEYEPVRMRRNSFLYDTSYPGASLPVIAVEFRPDSGIAGGVLDRVIPDTGADVGALPRADCQAIGFSMTEGIPGLLGGVGGMSANSLSFVAWVVLDGQEYPCEVLADFHGSERILGRDVLNRVDILFRGPAGEVVVNP